MLRNLIDNAVIQPSSKPEVVVRVVREGSQVCTEVQDFGPGIPPGNQALIFRRFFTQRPPGAPAGTGLGLSIVSAVVEAHQGRLELLAPKGGGATFRVILPG